MGVVGRGRGERVVKSGRTRYCLRPVSRSTQQKSGGTNPPGGMNRRGMFSRVWAWVVVVLAVGWVSGAGGMGGEARARQPLNDDGARDPSRAVAPELPGRGAAPTGPAQSLRTDESMPLSERPIREVRVVGVPEEDRDLVLAQVRARVGTPLNAQVVREDVTRLTRLGRFTTIVAEATPYDDGSVVLTYRCAPAPIIDDVQAVGNRQITDGQLAAEISLLRGTPLDEFQLGSAANRIRRLYREKGYYHATVTVEQEMVGEKVIVVFRIVEGDRLRVTDIRFEGNEAFTSARLRPAIRTRTAGIFESGPLDQETLDQDVAAIVTFYRDRGYLDVRADRRVIFAPNGREAIVTFLISEGPLYTLRSVKAVGSGGGAGGEEPGLRVMTAEQITGLLTIKTGDVYSVDLLRRGVDAVRNAYLRMGYVDVRIATRELRDETKPVVDLLLIITEGERFKTGMITVAGNEITQRKVILREMDTLKPDRPLDASSARRGDRLVNEAQRRIEELRLFEPGSVKLTIQPENPANPGYRDVLVEVEETNTGSIQFGAAVNSDAGVTGLLGLNQRNFDVADFPESWGEFFSGRAFRGAGQVFNVTLQPGTDSSRYSVSLAEPSLFDSDYSGSISGGYFQREFREYDEDRLSLRLGLGRRFGDVWTGSLFTRIETVNIRDIDADAPVDLFEVRGNNFLYGIGFSLLRTTLDSRFRPTQGARTELSVERIEGDFQFTKLSAQHQFYFPIYQDFLSRKTVMNIKLAASYIPEGMDDAPVFERYYLGGTSFRGYRFRTISPKGIRNDTGELGDDPVGGTWQFFAGTEIEQPVWQDVVSVVGFVDSGTVTEEIGFEDYRVSAGVGLRLRVPQLGPAPLAFDFGFPILKVDGDRERVFSFSIDIPF